MNAVPILQLSIKSLSDTQNSILDWTRRSEDVSHNLYIGLQGNPGRLGGNESDADFKASLYDISPSKIKLL